MHIGLLTSDVKIPGRAYGGVATWNDHMLRAINETEHTAEIIYRTKIPVEGVLCVDRTGDIDQLAGRFDGIIASHWTQPPFLLYMKQRLRIPLVFVVHSLEPCETRFDESRYFGGSHDRIATGIQCTTISLSDAVVLISDSEKRFYEELMYHHLNPSYTVIPSPFYSGTMEPIRKVGNTVGYIGRFASRKRPWVLPEGVERSGLKWPVVMMGLKGKEPYWDAWERRGVKMLPFSFDPVDIDEFWNKIDILAVTHIYEPDGYTWKEGAVRGKLLITARNGGPLNGLSSVPLSTIWYETDEKDPTEDVASFAAALRRASGMSSAERERMIERSRACLSKYEPTLSARRYLNLIERLAKLGTVLRANRPLGHLLD